MRKFFIFSLIGIAVIAAIVAFIGFMQLKNTKSFSPEEEVVFEQGDLKIKVFYNRPSKKGREIFGGLVPYEEVWRTGANEATTFDTNKDLTIEGKTLPAGNTLCGPYRGKTPGQSSSIPNTANGVSTHRASLTEILSSTCCRWMHTLLNRTRYLNNSPLRSKRLVRMLKWS